MMTDHTIPPPTLPLALTLGDPAGCGPQISTLAWKALRHDPDACFFVIGAPELYPHVPTHLIAHPREAAAVFGAALPVFPISVPPVRPGLPAAETAGAVVQSIRLATAFARAGEAAGVVTNPIHKGLLYGSGFAFPGHTEFLAALCAGAGEAPPRPVMMLVGGGLRVALATIHLPLRAVADALTTPSLVQLGEIVAAAMQRDFAIAAPRLVFTGLNPHAGEGGSIGREEIDIINPAAAILRQRGINMHDARPGDTVFAEALGGAFDAVIAMTHDQGLIPVKTLDLWGGVNVTLGLPIIRTSPDHGTAYDAAP
jgi:4-hydroxythreonine-4-phosphate dehydrogenase